MSEGGEARNHEAEIARLKADRDYWWARGQFPDPRPDSRAIFVLGDACERFKTELAAARSPQGEDHEVDREISKNAPLRERIADELAHNDECGPGPVSWQEYLADADAILRIVGEHGPQGEDHEARAIEAERDAYKAALEGIVALDSPDYYTGVERAADIARSVLAGESSTTEE